MEQGIAMEQGASKEHGRGRRSKLATALLLAHDLFPKTGTHFSGSCASSKERPNSAIVIKPLGARAAICLRQRKARRTDSHVDCQATDATPPARNRVP
jgi:hypothetical protein